MTQFAISVRPSPWPTSILSLKNNEKDTFYRFNDYPASYSMEVPKKISFPDPPRPPTPGPPRPPPIPPRPPVPTPPPSPNSSAEMEWLQERLVKNVSILAVWVMNAWFASSEPVSFPHPPRPPTPGPRPGPIGPRPDVPTPPPSPHRSAEGLGNEASQDDENTEAGGPCMTSLGRLFYECLDCKLNILYTPKSISYGPCEGENMNIQKPKLENKLTDDPYRDETRLHTLIYFPKSMSSPHMSHLNSYGEGKPGHLGQALRASTGTSRHSLSSPSPPTTGKCKRVLNGLDITSHGSSPVVTSPTVSGIYSQATSSIIAVV
ncbi:hypothetical protein F4774DRAFT_411166 [Daldinia eschscholtzii]|nr:hypothetical protein F4774DRAFT_411166 [Daldinia eschscholtzii]